MDVLSPIMPVALTLGQTLPQGGAVSLVVGLAGGIILWLLGGRVLKPAFALIGAALGGFAGVVLVPLTGLPAITLGGVSIGPGFVGLLVGAIVGALVSVGLFRVVITLSAGVVFLVAGTLAGLVYLQHVPEGSGDIRVEAAEALEGEAHEAADALRRGTDELRKQAGQTLEDLAGQVAGEEAQATGLISNEDMEAVKEQLRDAAQRSRAFLGEVRDNAQAAWNERTPRERVVILGSGMAGLLAGLIGGVLFPRRATALITALLGAAVWLFCAIALLRSLAGLGEGALAYSAQTWTVVWVGTAIIGLALQLGVIGRRGGGGDRDDDEDE